MTPRAFKMWRKRCGLSLSDAAAALSIARQTVALYANGNLKVPPLVAARCACLEQHGELRRLRDAGTIRPAQ